MALAKIKNLREKTNAGAKALGFLPKKGVVGLGSGTTIDVLAGLIPPGSGLSFYSVSKTAKKILKRKRLTLLKKYRKADVAFDGADSFVRGGALKGMGALDFVAEKKLDYNAKKLVLVVDADKMKKKENATVLLEAAKGKGPKVKEKLKKTGLDSSFVSAAKINKFGKKNDFIKIKVGRKTNFKNLERKLDSIKGILGSGIFTRKKFILVIGYKNRAVVKK